jgi:hypothetical protein
METDSAGKYGYDFGVCRHLGGKEDNRYEYEQRREHIHEVRDKVEIIVKDDSLQGSLLGNKVVNLLTDIEYDNDTDDQNKRDKESRDELPDYIQIYFSWSEI